MTEEKAAYFSSRFKEFAGDEVFGVGRSGWDYYVLFEEEELSSDMRKLLEYFPPQEGEDNIRMDVQLMTIDAVNYQALVEQLGVPMGSNILINHMRTHTSDGLRWEFEPINYVGQTFNVINRNNNIVKEIPLHGQLRIGQVPSEILFFGIHAITIIVPNWDSNWYSWYIEAENPFSFLDNANELVQNLDYPPYDAWEMFNAQQEQEWTRAMINLIMTLGWGFVALLTLIYITNIISTISTNIRYRAGEFAMLQSVGMTGGGLNRMLGLESALSSIKALVIGIPFGIIVAYLIHDAIGMAALFPFRLPLGAIVISILSVFILIWIVTIYSARMLRKRNIVETIRREMGV
jgi:putative ABC transport system permease protein